LANTSKRRRSAGYFDGALLIDPGRDLGSEKSLVDLRCVRDRKIQIFRKSISLEIALLEAGTALEDPGAGECSVRVDASENSSLST
jgi:hypothetical protein